MDYNTYETQAKLIDILQLIPENEMVTVRCDELGKGIHYVTLRPSQLAKEKKRMAAVRSISGYVRFYRIQHN